jgi:NitT/TauT family transport system substrate-binding protein
MTHQSRRRFIQTVAGLGVSGIGLALLAGCSRLETAARRGPAVQAMRGSALETTTLRFGAIPGSACLAPEYVAEDLLRADGFADVQYVDTAAGDIITALAAGDIQMNMNTVGIPIMQADTDNSTVMLAGIHVGCFELFGGRDPLFRRSAG